MGKISGKTGVFHLEVRKKPVRIILCRRLVSDQRQFGFIVPAGRETMRGVRKGRNTNSGGGNKAPGLVSTLLQK